MGALSVMFLTFFYVHLLLVLCHFLAKGLEKLSHRCDFFELLCFFHLLELPQEAA